jgi:hypothetical protein
LRGALRLDDFEHRVDHLEHSPNREWPFILINPACIASGNIVLRSVTSPSAKHERQRGGVIGPWFQRDVDSEQSRYRPTLVY